MKDDINKPILLGREIDINSYTKGFQDGRDYQHSKSESFKHTTAMSHMEDKVVKESQKDLVKIVHKLTPMAVIKG